MLVSYGGGIGTKMPLNHTSCHWIIDAMSLDQTLFYPTIFFMSLDRMSFYWTIFSMSLDRTSCHWIGLHAIGSDFMLLDLTSCYWIRLYVIGSYHSFASISFHWSTFIGSAVHHKKYFPECIQAQSSQGATGLKWFQLIP